ncbi:hypothetical protein Isop_1758 [Isosphaera pallida ATCC 43644]|uniref:Uncharacterized protein n=1 Tax=Isosphaera pallida (strain ATCC 43644 / DSM 9630 / IS1B) TaxID=575540 RepID=E8R1C4_ISOPI|nr:hypothetical protein [Isosphaera pallida]ADV62341.1 hypothetical protein Isop_1758 [Isosphaera pallida ATCC 43644]
MNLLVLVSGEGPTDMGKAGQQASEPCCGKDFEHGPMAVLVDRLIERFYSFSPIKEGLMYFVSRKELENKSKKLSKANQGRRELPSLKVPKETAFFYNQTRALATFANELAKIHKQTVIAVLFRDLDPKQSMNHRQRQDRWKSIVSGFKIEDFEFGIPMIPNPTSEAWLICLFQDQPYVGCQDMENRTSESLKDQLNTLVGVKATRDILVERLERTPPNFDRLSSAMISFKVFHDRVQEVLECLPTTRPTPG